MSFFNFKKKKIDVKPKLTPFQLLFDLNESHDFQKLLAASIGTARANQIHFNEQVVKGQDWSVDLQTSRITFGAASYPIQLIGTESTISNTWVWSWVNLSQLPETSWQDMLPIKEELKDFLHFTTEEIDLNELVNGHNLSSIVAGFHPAHVCYYRCPYDGGAAYVLVKDLPTALFPPLSRINLQKIILEVIAEQPAHHRIAVTSFLLENGGMLTETAESILAELPNDGLLSIKFNQQNRVSSITLD
ncbi:DUF6882 domain-containing protein [Carnobacterium gallinarum]|uniref:DUF6882 domain-containing protein n=1 Tax=Carnobacterium gallinarum TaxID=2749 RepID=UPI000691D0ED|nr:DUF6882 domain-containing protein [Carnobacterium gallinarum]